MISKINPKLIFEGGFDEQKAIESRDRGYRSHVWVEFPNGERYSVVFYDSVRLEQDLRTETEEGNPYIAEPGLIVVPEVTQEYMERAVCGLADNGFFDSLRPEGDQADITSR